MDTTTTTATRPRRPPTLARAAHSRLTATRLSCGLSLREAARQINVSPEWLSSVERDRYRANDERKRRLADLYGVGVGWLFFDET